MEFQLNTNYGLVKQKYKQRGTYRLTLTIGILSGFLGDCSRGAGFLNESYLFMKRILASMLLDCILFRSIPCFITKSLVVNILIQTWAHN